MRSPLQQFSVLLLTLGFPTLTAGGSQPDHAAGQEDFLRAMKEKLTINARAVGPFGLPQTRPESGCTLPPCPPRTPLSRLLSGLTINGIDGKNRMVVMGAREFGEGQVLHLKSSEGLRRIEIIEIRSDSIRFQDCDSGQSATRTLDLDPENRVRVLHEFHPRGVEEAGSVPLIEISTDS